MMRNMDMIDMMVRDGFGNFQTVQTASHCIALIQ